MKQSKETLKEHFETGDKPTQEQYSDLIDSYVDSQQEIGEANRRFVINETGEVSVTSEIAILETDVNLINDYTKVSGSQVIDQSIGNVTIYEGLYSLELSDVTNINSTIYKGVSVSTPLRIKITGDNDTFGYVNAISLPTETSGSGWLNIDSAFLLDENGNDISPNSNLQADNTYPASIEISKPKNQEEFNKGIIGYVEEYTHSLDDVLNKNNVSNKQLHIDSQFESGTSGLFNKPGVSYGYTGMSFNSGENYGIGGVSFTYKTQANPIPIVNVSSGGELNFSSNDIDNNTYGTNYIFTDINTQTGATGKVKFKVKGTDNTADIIHSFPEKSGELEHKEKEIETPPSSSTDTGTKGQVIYANTGIYVCVATNTWIKTQLDSGF